LVLAGNVDVRAEHMVISVSSEGRTGRLCGQRRKRIGKIRPSDLVERLVDSDGLGWPCGMHDEHDGSGAAATRIAAIAFADADDSFVIGVDGRPGMPFQFKHRVPLVV
jgi:hypothetical protein